LPAYRLQFPRKTVDINGMETCRLFGAEEGHADLGVDWMMLPPGCVTRPNREPRARAVIVLSGLGRGSVDGRAEGLGAGFALYVPAGAEWILENTGRQPLVCYAIATPAGPPAAGAASHE